MLKALTQNGIKRHLPTNIQKARNMLSVLTAIYLLTAVLFYPEPLLHRSICFGLFFAFIFISYASPGSKCTPNIPVYDWVFALASISVSFYIALNLDRMIQRYVYFDNVLNTDVFFGILTVILLIEGTRRILGPWLPALSLLALLYMFLGHLIPGRFGHRGFSLLYAVDGLFLSNYGIWGSTLGIATGHIMIFLIYGCLFLKSGAGDFLFDFVSVIAGKSKGGVAKIAIISSALFGMISGSPIANVSTTGAMTIPTMKRQGYSSVFSASVESCVSVGGVFMPPIMGSVAFMMAEVVGIPYAQVAKAAFLPALLYFAALFFTIDIRSRKIGIEGLCADERKPLLPLLKKGLGFFVPLTYLILRLMMGASPSRVGLESIGVIILINLFNKEHPMNPGRIADALRLSIERGVMIVATMGTCGILIGVVNITGIAAKFSASLMSVSNASVMVTLLLVMAITLFLGLAMNITSAYLITAVMCAPILINLGYLPISVHMFILFFAAMATITPPVAMTSFAAATIAEASPMMVGFMAMRMGIVAYMLPFVFIFNPAILLIGSIGDILFSFVSAFMGVGLIALGMEGWWFFRKVNVMYRSVITIAGLLALSGFPVLTAVSIGIVFFVYLYYQHKTMEVINEKI